MLDTRSGETFKWRKQTRPFKIDRPGRYERYRLEASGTLAEIELLNHDEAVPLGTEVGSSAAWPGSTVPVRVEVWNSGGASLSGDVALSVPDGWSASPPTRSFGPLATGRSQTLTFDVNVPAGVEPGEYHVEAKATSGSVEVHGTGSVQVLGDTIEFSPGTSAEEPWLSEDGGSQLDGPADDGRGRFTDNERFFVYKFELPADVTGRDAQPATSATSSTSRRPRTGRAGPRCCTRTGRSATSRTTSGATSTSTTLRGSGRTVYLRFSDSFPSDGWGGWLGRTKLVLQR